jgi:hypothetical protein
MSREMVEENAEDFFFFTGTESGFLRHSKEGGRVIKNYPFGRLEKCLTFSS